MISHRKALGAFFILFTSTLFAQSYQAEVRGLVTDASHAAISGAKVTLTDETKQVVRSTVSDAAGQYIFNQVDPAGYRVSVEATGFKHFERSAIAVGTQQSITVDVSLEVGDASQTVLVSAAEPLLDKTNGSTSTSLDGQQISDLPSSTSDGRNEYTVISVSQNVIPVIPSTGFLDQSDVSTISIAGSPESTNLFLIDGVPITDTINRPTIIPSTEATQELKVQVTTYDAEVGRTGGGVYNTVLKSGTNSLHGSLFGVTRQSAFNANDFFFNRNGLARPSIPYYNYAGSIGGPVYIPHLYDGRDKTFFFFAEEGMRERQFLSSNYQVPTDLERAGDFSQSGVTIYNPFDQTVNPDGSVTRHPFPNNVIPAQLINTVGKNIASYYPHPNLSGLPTGAVNYTLPAAAPEDRGDEFVGKIDHQFFPWWSANVSYLHYGSLIPFGNALGTVPGSGSITYDRHVDATQLNNIFTVNPTTLVSIRFGFNRFPNTILPLSKGFSPTNLGLPAYNYQYSFFPPVNVTNFTPLSVSTATTDFWYSRNLFTQVAKQVGRHSLKAGFDFRAIDLSYTDFSSAPGNFNFTGQFTQSSPTVQNGGSAIADLLLGLPVSGQIETSQRFYQYIHYWGVYVQDEFRVTPKLTLNAGLRYEYETGLKDSNNNLVVGFNETVASPLAVYKPGTVGGLEFAGTGGRDETGQLSKLKFAPRLGYAYALGQQTTIRGGFGIFYSPLRYDATAALQTGFTTETQLISSNDNYQTPAPGFTLNNPFPSGPLPPTGNVNRLLTGIGNPIAAYDSAIKSPVIYQFSTGIQRQLPSKILLEVDYVGSRGRHLLPSPQGGGSASPAGGGRTNIDQLNPSYFSLGSTALGAETANPFYQAGGPGLIGQPTVAAQQLLLPYPQFASVNLITTDSASSYNSFAVRAERRLASGLTFLTTYTWSRNYDGSYETSSPAGSSNVGPQNIYDLKAEYGRSFIDVPNRFTLAAFYGLPFGRDKKFLANAGRWNNLVGGWNLTAVTSYQNGFPLNVTQNNLNSSIGAAVQRPNINPGVSAKTSGSIYTRVNGFIDPDAFAQVPEYQFGNLPKATALRGPGPGSSNWNATLLKTVTVKERVNFTFRAEAQNVFNHPWFSMPNTTLGTTTFGQITSTNNGDAITNARSLQIGGRITF
jgi:trimeric autotransporter adhesin